ncbi:hypothetical protein HMPREF0262_01884 [Clostridium sp. ATCC 29733]|nr:hypothetical protein HMPREF0262_01884 [Clostridium sp. ATCC 29733]
MPCKTLQLPSNHKGGRTFSREIDAKRSFTNRVPRRIMGGKEQRQNASLPRARKNR